MREIKFRGKRVDNGAWVEGYVNEIYTPENTETLTPTVGDFPVDPATVGQFTGRHDTNAKDVYEGDLWKRGQFTGIIEFKLGGWHITPHPKSAVVSYPAFNSNIDSGEVTGNIHEEAS